MISKASCSRCGAKEYLSLVILPYSEGVQGGRILVYCRKCQAEYRSHIEISIPMEELSEELLLNLYREGKTESDPETVASLILKIDSPGFVTEANHILKQHRSDGDYA